MVDTPRRRVLAAAATGTTLSLAGCSSLGSDGTDGAAQTDDADSSGDASATVAVDIQSDLQAAQTDIRQRLQEGNLTQAEAQAEIRETQLDLLTEAVSTVESHASDTEGLTVDQTNARAGAVLVSGAPAAVLGVLDADSVSALLAGDEFPEPQQSAANESENGSETDTETDSTNDSS